MDRSESIWVSHSTNLFGSLVNVKIIQQYIKYNSIKYQDNVREGDREEKKRDPNGVRRKREFRGWAMESCRAY